MARKNEIPESSPFTKYLASQFEIERKKQGLTYKQIAEALGKAQSYVSNRMTGKAPFTTEDLERLAKLLGYSNAYELFDMTRGATNG